jgi:hypothetical protein
MRLQTLTVRLGLTRASLFAICSIALGTSGDLMSGEEKATLRPANAQEIAESLSFALRFDGRKRARHADEAMARITAERLVKHLERSGYVIMQKPGRVAPSTSGHSHPNAGIAG